MNSVPLRPLSLVVAVAVLLVTGVLTWAASAANQSSNKGLLRLQVREAASTLSAALPSIQSRLDDALTVANDTNSAAVFRRFVSHRFQQGGFVSVSLWRRTGGGIKLLTFVGARPELVSKEASGFFTDVRATGSLQVTRILSGSPPRLGFATSAPADRFVVYAESRLPADRKLAVPKTSAFGELNYAIYLGPSQNPSELLESSIPTPIRGLHAAVSVPFGDTAITVVGTPRGPLVGGVSAALPWIVLAVGIGLALAGAATVEHLITRRTHAEQLSRELGTLYTNQRGIAETLQHALLPVELPRLPDMEVAARYRAGSVGVDVGGDWYDIVPVSDGVLVFVVGDVSGRGVEAAAVMASLRFAARAFALEGHPPDAILQRLCGMLTLEADGHFATVLCGRLDVGRHEVALASAGHLPPVVITGRRARTIQPGLMPPIGVADPASVMATVTKLAAGATLIAYTDGLVERRDEGLDAGIRRLEQAALAGAPSLDALLGRILSDLTMDAPDDDVAMLGLRCLN